MTGFHRADIRRRLARLCHEESGFTLTELMVTCLLMVIVLSALYGIFDQSIRIFKIGNDRLEAVETARVGLEKIERELRAAYPVDRVNSKQHVFFAAGLSATPAKPSSDEITFGNDLKTGGAPPNRKVDAFEEITYRLLQEDLATPCPTSGIVSCVLARRQEATSTYQPVVERVVPGGLTLSYFDNTFQPDGTPNAATNASGTDIRTVRIKLTVLIDGQRQTLTTDVDLRNR